MHFCQVAVAVCSCRRQRRRRLRLVVMVGVLIGVLVGVVPTALLTYDRQRIGAYAKPSSLTDYYTNVEAGKGAKCDVDGFFSLQLLGKMTTTFCPIPSVWYLGLTGRGDVSRQVHCWYPSIYGKVRPLKH